MQEMSSCDQSILIRAVKRFPGQPEMLSKKGRGAYRGPSLVLLFRTNQAV